MRRSPTVFARLEIQIIRLCYEEMNNIEAKCTLTVLITPPLQAASFVTSHRVLVLGYKSYNGVPDQSEILDTMHREEAQAHTEYEAGLDTSHRTVLFRVSIPEHQED